MTITFKSFRNSEPGVIAKWIVLYEGEHAGLITQKISPTTVDKSLDPHEYLFTFWQDWDEERGFRPGPIRCGTLEEIQQAAKDAEYV